MRKEPTYKIEILVKSARNITVLEFLSKTKTLKCRTACKKYRVIEQGLFRHPVQISRDLESKIGKMNDVKRHFWSNRPKLISISKCLSQANLSKKIQNAIKI